MVNTFALGWILVAAVFFLFFSPRDPRTIYNSPLRFWMRNEFLYNHYMKRWGYSDEEFYTKFHCLMTAEDFDPIEKTNTLLNRHLTNAQRDVLIRDIFDPNFTCPWGNQHLVDVSYASPNYNEVKAERSEKEYDFMEVSRPVLCDRIAEKGGQFLDPDSRGILFSFRTKDAISNLIRLGIFHSDDNEFWMRYAPREAFNGYFHRLLEATNTVIVRDAQTTSATSSAYSHNFKADLDGAVLPFIKKYVLDVQRTHDEIYELAQEPYQWFADILFESPLMLDEDKVMSILIVNSSGGN